VNMPACAEHKFIIRPFLPVHLDTDLRGAGTPGPRLHHGRAASNSAPIYGSWLHNLGEDSGSFLFLPGKKLLGNKSRRHLRQNPFPYRLQLPTKRMRFNPPSLRRRKIWKCHICPIKFRSFPKHFHYPFHQTNHTSTGTWPVFRRDESDEWSSAGHSLRSRSKLHSCNTISPSVLKPGRP
jgi:hypothetical protein